MKDEQRSLRIRMDERSVIVICRNENSDSCGGHGNHIRPAQNDLPFKSGSSYWVGFLMEYATDVGAASKAQSKAQRDCLSLSLSCCTLAAMIRLHLR